MNLISNDTEIHMHEQKFNGILLCLFLYSVHMPKDWTCYQKSKTRWYFSSLAMYTYVYMYVHVLTIEIADTV